jgi:hypothetical protein
MEGLLARLVCLPLCNQGAISFAHLQGERNPLHVAVGSQNVALITALSTQVTMITLAPAVHLPAHSFQAHPDPVVEIGPGFWRRDVFGEPITGASQHNPSLVSCTQAFHARFA